jgi:nitroreductase
MEFAEVVRKRRMVRNFRPDPVDPAAIERILDLARHAPSAGFTQGQSFVIVTQPDVKQRIAEVCGEAQYVQGGFHPFVSGAPVLIVACTSETAYHRRYQEPDKLQDNGTEIDWPVPYWHMDVGCAVMILLLAAVEEGLAAGFAGAHDLDALRALLGIPKEVTPVGVIAIGHPAPDVPSPSLRRGRKPREAVVFRERWAAPSSQDSASSK